MFNDNVVRLWVEGPRAPGGSVMGSITAANVSCSLFRAMIIDFLIAVVKFILDMLWTGLAFHVGELVLRLVSFGSVRAAPIDVPFSEFNWFCYRRDGNGRIEVESTLAGGIGLIFCFIGLALVLHFVR